MDEYIDLLAQQNPESILAGEIDAKLEKWRETNIKKIQEAKTLNGLTIPCFKCFGDLVRLNKCDIDEPDTSFMTMIFKQAEPIIDQIKQKEAGADVKIRQIRAYHLNFECNLSPLIAHKQSILVYDTELQPSVLEELQNIKSRR